MWGTAKTRSRYGLLSCCIVGRLFVFQTNVENTTQFKSITNIVSKQAQDTNQYVDVTQEMKAKLSGVECKGDLNLGNIGDIKVLAVTEQVVSKTNDLKSTIMATSQTQLDNMINKYQDFLSSPSAGTDLKNNIKNRVETAINTSITNENVQRVAQQVRLHQIADVDLKDILVGGDCTIRNEALVDLFARSLMNILETTLKDDKQLVDIINEVSLDLEEHSSGIGDIAQGLFKNIWIWLAIAAVVIIAIVVMVLMKPKAAAEVIGAVKGK